VKAIIYRDNGGPEVLGLRNRGARGPSVTTPVRRRSFALHVRPAEPLREWSQAVPPGGPPPCRTSAQRGRLAQQDRAFALVGAQPGRQLQLGARLRSPAEPGQQLPTHRRYQM